MYDSICIKQKRMGGVDEGWSKVVSRASKTFVVTLHPFK